VPGAAPYGFEGAGLDLTGLSQLWTFFGFFALFFIVKACVFIGAL